MRGIGFFFVLWDRLTTVKATIQQVRFTEEGDSQKIRQSFGLGLRDVHK
jgi:hypothetical protein